MLQAIENIDQWLLPLFNGGNSMFVDQLAILLTNGLTWVPFYIALLVLVVKNNEKALQVLLIIGMVLTALLFTGGLNDLIVKPLAARPRPFADPSMHGLITTVNGYKPSGYSFFSSHAANTFALAVFLSMVVRNKVFTAFMLLWAALNGWTRLYLGVHFPSDVVVGTLWGAVVGCLVSRLYKYLYFKISPRLHYISTQYTKTGYDLNDIDFALNVLVLTITVVVIMACCQTM